VLYCSLLQLRMKNVLCVEHFVHVDGSHAICSVGVFEGRRGCLLQDCLRRNCSVSSGSLCSGRSWLGDELGHGRRARPGRGWGSLALHGRHGRWAQNLGVFA
jgi:hypothetical protein